MSTQVHATADPSDGGDLNTEHLKPETAPATALGHVFKCSDCQKYCDDQGRWLRIDSAAISIAVVELEAAGEVKAITCGICSNGFQRAACAGTQVFNGAPVPAPSPAPRPERPAKQKPRKPFELRSSLPPTDR
jgi:hypothetical protein